MAITQLNMLILPPILGTLDFRRSTIPWRRRRAVGPFQTRARLDPELATIKDRVKHPLSILLYGTGLQQRGQPPRPTPQNRSVHLLPLPVDAEEGQIRPQADKEAPRAAVDLVVPVDWIQTIQMFLALPTGAQQRPISRVG